MPRIVVIEDDVALSTMYVFKLKNEGFEVRSAANGQEGLAVIESFRPELILLDLRMPVMSGDEMLAKLRAAEYGGGIRVIILTNISRSEAPMSLRLLGVDRYVVKAHHTPAQVVQIIQEIIGK